MLLVAALCLAVTSVLLAQLGRQCRAVPRSIRVTAWITAATLCLGMSVVLLVPFAAWSIAVGVTWTTDLHSTACHDARSALVPAG